MIFILTSNDRIKTVFRQRENMMSYIDKYGLYNVKHCISGEPSGNDGFIITAYAIKLGLEVNFNLINSTYLSLKSNNFELRRRTVRYLWSYPVERLPNKADPMPSRDLGESVINCLNNLRAFYYRLYDIKAPFIYRLIEFIDKKIGSKSDSSKLIRWLKYDKMPEIEVFERYFGKDHPIYKKVLSFSEK